MHTSTSPQTANLLWGGWQPQTSHVRHYPVNEKGRDFVVGDLHGCLEPLQRLLAHVGFHPASDRLFSVGDIIDRGPYSIQCLRLLRQPWFFSCKGNHEALLLAHLRQPRQNEPFDAAWLHALAPKFSDRQKLAGEWIDVLERLPEVMVVGAGTPGRFQVVHAEILEEKRAVTDALIDTWMFGDGERAATRCVWGRGLVQAYQRQKPVRRAHDPERTSPIFCGHTIVPSVLQLACQIFIDRGAFAGQPDVAMAAGEADPWLREEIPDPGLILAEPKTHQFWFASTLPGRSDVFPVSCLVPDTA